MNRHPNIYDDTYGVFTKADVENFLEKKLIGQFRVMPPKNVGLLVIKVFSHQDTGPIEKELQERLPVGTKVIFQHDDKLPKMRFITRPQRRSRDNFGQ